MQHDEQMRWKPRGSEGEALACAREDSRRAHAAAAAAAARPSPGVTYKGYTILPSSNAAATPPSPHRHTPVALPLTTPQHRTDTASISRSVKDTAPLAASELPPDTHTRKTAGVSCRPRVRHSEYLAVSVIEYVRARRRERDGLPAVKLKQRYLFHYIFSQLLFLQLQGEGSSVCQDDTLPPQLQLELPTTYRPLSDVVI